MAAPAPVDWSCAVGSRLLSLTPSDLQSLVLPPADRRGTLKRKPKDGDTAMVLGDFAWQLHGTAALPLLVATALYVGGLAIDESQLRAVANSTAACEYASAAHWLCFVLIRLGDQKRVP